MNFTIPLDRSLGALPEKVLGAACQLWALEGAREQLTHTHTVLGSDLLGPGRGAAAFRVNQTCPRLWRL